MPTEAENRLFLNWVENTPEGQTWAKNFTNPQLSLGGPVVSEGNQWGIGSPIYAKQHLNVGTRQSTWTDPRTGEVIPNYVPGTPLAGSGGIVWNGSGPAPTGATKDAQVAELLRGSIVDPKEATRATVGGTAPVPPPGASGPVQNPGSGANASSTTGPNAGSTADPNAQLKAFLEYLAGRAGSASPIVGRPVESPPYASRPGGPAYGAIVQKGLL